MKIKKGTVVIALDHEGKPFLGIVSEKKFRANNIPVCSSRYAEPVIYRERKRLFPLGIQALTLTDPNTAIMENLSAVIETLTHNLAEMPNVQLKQEVKRTARRDISEAVTTLTYWIWRMKNPTI